MIKTEDLGKHKNVLALHFGSGDIGMANSFQPDQQQHILFFYQHTPKPVEEFDLQQCEPGTSSDEIENVKLIMTFSRPESIDTLIAMLKDYKNKLSQPAFIPVART